MSPNYNETNWSFNPNYFPPPYLYDDTRYAYNEVTMEYDGLETDAEFTPVKPTNWDNT